MTKKIEVDHEILLGFRNRIFSINRCIDEENYADASFKLGTTFSEIDALISDEEEEEEDG